MDIFTLLNFIALAFVGHSSLQQTNVAAAAAAAAANSLTAEGAFGQLCLDEYKAKLVIDKSLRAGGEVERLFSRYNKLVEGRILIGHRLGINYCPPELIKDIVDELREIANPSFHTEPKVEPVQPAHFELDDVASASKQTKEMSISLKSQETFKQLCLDEYTAKLVHDKSLRAGHEVERLFKTYKKLTEKRILFGHKHGIYFCPPELVKDIVDRLREIANSSSQSADSELEDEVSARKHNKEKDSFKSKVSNLFGRSSGSQQRCSD